MRYPVNNFKTEWNMTAGYGFGAKTSYGYHDGIDLNKNGGGDIELGDPIYAIVDGDLVYYHTAKHPKTDFGFHHVYKIVGPWGTRWVHNSHCEPSLIAEVQPVKENQIIAKVGKSGTQYAHNHFSIFKVDPATLRNGIDTIAKTEAELNAWWEDPIKFIEKWMQQPLPEPNPGYAPTHEGQTVEKDGKIYRSYKKDNQLLWTVSNKEQEDWKKKYETEVQAHASTRSTINLLLAKIENAKKALS